jgi:drug/metabolite transporter (DMT)-like permease
MDGPAVAAMLLVCLCWGSQNVAIKLAARGMTPVLQVGLRSAGSAFLVGALMLWRGEGCSWRDDTFWPGVFAGLVFGATFLCVAVGLAYTTASHMAVFLYTAPVFAALGLHWLVAGEHLNPAQWLGVILAFGGIAFAFSDGFGGRATGGPDALRGDLLGVTSGVLWATSTVLIRRTALSEAPPTRTLFYQLAGGAVILLAVAASFHREQVIAMNQTVWLSLVFQVLAIGFASFLLWFWLLRRYLASRLVVFSFLTPIIGVTIAVLVLKDPLDLRFIIGATLVLAGIATVNLTRKT